MGYEKNVLLFFLFWIKEIHFFSWIFNILDLLYSRIAYMCVCLNVVLNQFKFSLWKFIFECLRINFYREVRSGGILTKIIEIFLFPFLVFNKKDLQTTATSVSNSFAGQEKEFETDVDFCLIWSFTFVFDQSVPIYFHFVLFIFSIMLFCYRQESNNRHLYERFAC